MPRKDSDKASIERKVLAIDDNPDTLEIVRVMLEMRGMAVKTATGGEEGLALLATWTPDVVLLDMMMPGMSGDEVLEKIRATESMCSIPVIIMTAKARDQDMLDGYETGADYYIPKPFNAKQMLYGIGLVLGDPDLGGDD